MSTLKRKAENVWQTIVLPDDFPTQIEKKIIEIQPNFTSFSTSENGEFFPQAPYNGFSVANITVPVGGLPSVFRAGDTPVLLDGKLFKATSTSAYVESTLALTIPKTGQYRIKWGVGEGDGSTRYSVYTRLYKNGDPVGSEHISDEPEVVYEDLDLNAIDEIAIWIKGYSNYGTWGTVSNLVACIDWNIWG